MDDQLRSILERMTTELTGWLEQPGEASKKLAALRTQIGELKGEIGADGLADALKGLEQAEKTAARQRQHQAAIAIAELCKPLGVILEAKEPPKRRPRTRKQGGTPAQPAGE
ncbi:MAG: hypothetical protein AAFN41_08325 [Planctomycetota bacterium]